jgi:hypothetical protein
VAPVRLGVQLSAAAALRLRPGAPSAVSSVSQVAGKRTGRRKSDRRPGGEALAQVKEDPSRHQCHDASVRHRVDDNPAAPPLGRFGESSCGTDPAGTWRRPREVIAITTHS